MASLPVPANSDEVGGMTDDELVRLLRQHENNAVGYFDSEIAAQQAKAIDYYYGRMNDVPAPDNCSTVVDESVAVMVDNGLAAILKPFVSADEVVRFEPRGPEDVAMAEQATEYVNYVINCDNPGFLIFHDWFKDGLLTKLGTVKVWWEDRTRQEVRQQVVDPIAALQAREAEGYQGEQENPDGSFTVSMLETIPDGQVIVRNVPPEEVLIPPYTRSIEEAGYAAHRPSNFTRSDLIEMGVDPEVVADLPAYADGRTEESRKQARYVDEDTSGTERYQSPGDPSRDIIGVLDEYVRVDYDGDGVSELRRVVRVNDIILFNEEVADIPFATVCPVPMPHKVYGLSTADLSIQGQRIGTALLRQSLDNLYKSNNPRPVINESGVGDSTMDDLADTAPGAAIRTRGPQAIEWLTVPFSARESMPMLEYSARQTEERTGFQRKGQGFNAEALKKNSPDTATQAAIDENSRNERAEMVARIFAETGVKRLFKLILRLLVDHQPKARVIRLRNQWVEMDPSGWDPEMDLSISVGLGIGNKADQIMQADAVLQTMAELQQTPYAYLIDETKVHNALKRKFIAAGIKNVDDFLVDPGQVQKPEPQPSPEQQKMQAEMAMKAQDQQFRQQESAAKLQAQREESAARVQLMRDEAAEQLRLAREKAEFEAQLAVETQDREFELEERRMERQFELDARRAEQQATLSKKRPGGDLDK